MALTIKKSEWGWTAYHPSGRPVAHAATKTLLEAYVKDCTR